MSASLRAALLPAVSLLVLAACDRKGADDTDAAATTTASSAASSSGSDDLADVAKFRLTMDRIDKYVAAQRNIAAKVNSMSPAERAAAEAKNEGDNSSDQSLDGMAKRIESVPQMRDAVREAGLSTREFALITYSMMQSAMAASVLQMRPKDNQDSLVREMKANPDNVKFYREHEAEITRKMKALEGEMKAAGMSNDG